MRFLKIILLSVFLVTAIYFLSRQSDPTISKVEVVSTPESFKTVIVNNIPIRYVYWTSKPENIDLISNFDEKLSSSELSKKHNCLNGINGSFYDEKFEPLAWWKNKNMLRKNFTLSYLLNGYIMLSNEDLFIINKEKPVEEVKWGMQAGPLLINNGVVEKLSMTADKPARRNIAAINSLGDMVGLSIFSENSKYDGPTLTDLPVVVKAVSEKENLNLVNAINLDGGSASGFYSPDLQLPELVMVGSWLCAKE